MMRSHLSAAFALVLACAVGCAPTIRSPSAPSAPASAQECAELDASQATWGTVTFWALLGSVIGATVGFAADADGKASRAAMTGGASAGFVGAFAFGLHSGKVREFSNKGCAGPAPKEIDSGSNKAP